ncbi:MAG: leucine-rich repeat domain-containing protein [Sulfurimonas sp.]|jgi:Leucine-rich repeat (LRR) protein
MKDLIEIKYEGRILREVSENETALALSYQGIQKISQIKGLANLVKLDGLSLSNNKIGKIDGLNKLVNLRYLALWGNEISKIEGLDKLVNLNELDLDGNPISQIKGLEKIKCLSIEKALNLFCERGVLKFQKQYNLPNEFSGKYLESHPNFLDMCNNNNFLLFCVKMMQQQKGI